RESGTNCSGSRHRSATTRDRGIIARPSSRDALWGGATEPGRSRSDRSGFETIILKNQMRFPQTFIDDLRRQADVVRIIQDYVPLKKKGSNWMACCPFHKEKTPSFSVSPAK